MMKSLLKSSLYCLLSACLATACIEHTVYHSYQSLSNEGWVKGDTLSFSIPITDSIPKSLKLYAEVRNKSNYPYRELYLVVSQNLQGSAKWQTDTLAIQVADSTGRWLGNGWSSIYQLNYPIGKAICLHPGDYTFKVTHGMKDERLVGLNDVGIRIEK